MIGYLILGMILGVPLGWLCMLDFCDSLTAHALDRRIARWIEGDTPQCDFEVINEFKKIQ